MKYKRDAKVRYTAPHGGKVHLGVLTGRVTEEARGEWWFVKIPKGPGSRKAYRTVKVRPKSVSEA